MDRKPLLICSVIGFLGLLSAASGFAAEATRIKASSLQLIAPTQCAYPQSPALALGLTAAFLLMMTQIAINVATWYTCRDKKSSQLSNHSWTIALGCLATSWFTSAVAFFLLLTAAAMNERHSEDNSNFKNYYCYIVKPGVFAAGAALSLVSVILGMLYYLIFTSQQESDAADSGLPEPHIQRRRDPVFVHEDTYMRRQSA
ncbi:hypothetical protein SAY86_001596 [Trapa natans]|uniref:Uncharacterized protein n=1 Tax=Trapa natans TaxID=22666 RepID=A0AAN7QZM5_TRANT|nr:hypothetical protein SAY86_001596 [Trapa natans]